MKAKRCPQCKEVKGAGEFYRDRSKKDGLAWDCKICKSKRSRHGDMKHRCLNKNNKWYKDYGGRGISIEPYLMDYNNYQHYIDSLPRKEGEDTIDRIDNDGNYERGNLRWASSKAQRDNQRRRCDQYYIEQVCKETGRVLAVYESIHDASRKTGVAQQDICACVNKTVKRQKKAKGRGYYYRVPKTAGGFIWRKKDE